MLILTNMSYQALNVPSFFFFFQVGFQVLSSIKLSCFFLDLPAF